MTRMVGQLGLGATVDVDGDAVGDKVVNSHDPVVVCCVIVDG